MQKEVRDGEAPSVRAGLAIVREARASPRTRMLLPARGTLRVRFSEAAKSSPEVRVAWLHEYSDNRYAITSRFIGCEGLFRVHGPGVGDDAALVSAGVTIQITPMLSLFGHYDGIFGRDNYDSHSASGGLALSFK